MSKIAVDVRKNYGFSIIIPIKKINAYVRETIRHILLIKNKKWQLIILTNDEENNEWVDKRIQLISTGKISPARKRDIGSKYAKYNILVFLDDDSYPESNILDIAANYFKKPSIVALGGPAITPRTNSLWQKVSGAVFISRWSGGFPERYLSIGKTKIVEDWPSVNLMVRRDDFIEIGGFNNDFWPGEDTKLCLDLIKKTGKSIVYAPEMIVWHHRRAGFFQHLKQVGAYGKHRGYFAREFPDTSFKLIFFIPALFSIFSILSLLTLFISLDDLLPFFIFGWLTYCIALFKAFYDISQHEKKIIAALCIFYIIPTHFWYGIQFIIGISSRNLKSALR